MGKHSGWGTYSPGTSNIKQDGASAVELISDYSSPGGGIIPGILTLGTITTDAGWQLNGRTTFRVSGGIAFHNSPDQMQINYKMPTQRNNSLIQYRMIGTQGDKTLEWTDDQTTNDYNTYTYDLSEINDYVGEPSSLNLTLCSHYHFSSNQSTPFIKVGDMSVDWIKLLYNHTLTGLTVNGIPATLSGNDFTATLTDPEYIELPQLAFTGEVNDQAQQVVWSAETVEGEYGVRQASIRNFAENGTDYTDYTLSVRRPLCTINTMDSLYINGSRYMVFTAGTTDYTIHLLTTDRLPDLQVFPASSRQQITTIVTSTEATITVTPEYGEATVYTIHFVVDKSGDTTLSALTEVTAFDPAQTTYTYVGDSLPDFYFTRAHDRQMVEVNNGIITVTAEDGSVGIYTISLQARTYTTMAQLSEIELDGTPWQDFASDTYIRKRDPKPFSIRKRIHATRSFIYKAKRV